MEKTIERAVKDETLLIDPAVVAAEQFFALVRGEPHFHFHGRPSFWPSRAEQPAPRRRLSIASRPI